MKREKTDKNTVNPIQVADKIFQVIEILAATGAMGLLDISRTLNLNKTTAHRILNSLIYMGYVKQDTETSKYSLGFKICDLASRVLTQINIVEIAKPHLKKLVDLSGETVHLVQLEGCYAVYVDKIESTTNSVRLVSQMGKRLPLYCSGVGKALLADMGDEDILEIWKYSEIEKLTSTTIVDVTLFMKEIIKIRNLGYSIDNEENELGVKCIAASIPNYSGNSQYAFSISAPLSRMENDRIKELSKYVIETKEILGRVMK